MRNEPNNERLIWLVSGEDVRMRIPLVHKLRERGFEVAVAGSDDEEPFREQRIPYWTYPLGRWISPRADRLAREQLTELIRRHAPRIVHSFDTKPALLAPHAVHDAQTSISVRTINGMGYLFSSASPLALALRPVYRKLQRQASERSSVTVFQNRDDRLYFRERGMVQPGRDDLVLGSGVDFERLRDRPDSSAAVAELRSELRAQPHEVFVLMVGRMVRHKGVREFLRAARRVRSSRPHVRFVLVGPIASEGRQAVSRREIDRFSADVDYLGRRDDIPTLLELADVFALPSYYREGVPRVLLEAGAMGLPLITTDMPGCREVVEHDVNGLLVAPRNTQQLAQAVERLVDSPSARQRMGARNRIAIPRAFGLDHVADQYAEIYNRLLQKSSRRILTAA